MDTRRRLSVSILTVPIVILFGAAGAAQTQCPLSYSGADAAKPNKLFLYFPIAVDNTFPATYGAWSPAKIFDNSLLDPVNLTGPTQGLRDAVFGVVVDDYCEFNNQVIQTTTNPELLVTPPARRQTVAIGADSNDGLYGQAQSVDTGDNNVRDFARVWGATYETYCSANNSTLQQWSFSLGGTAAHEAGHNYGLAHSTVVRTGEDSFHRHLMPAGPSITCAERSGYRRHFSDEDFGILAANIGLSVQTVHNWDFVNPNSSTAYQLQMELLSLSSPLTLSWFYGGSSSPWTSPTVTTVLGTVLFKGVTYNHYRITWVTPQAWSGGPPGVVPAGAGFHVGAEFTGLSFSTPDPVIITNVTLFDALSNPLPLHPRIASFDSGVLDAHDGAFRLNIFNADRGLPLQVKNITVAYLPRVLSIQSMIAGASMLSWEGLPVIPWRTLTCPDSAVDDAVSCTIGFLKQGRNIYVNTQRGLADSVNAPDVNENPLPGINIDLFPATTVYVTARVVEPNATFWDPNQSRFVTGPLETKIFYQFAGMHPDLNHNGVDDFIDIAKGVSRDLNGDGVPDEAQTGALQPVVAITPVPNTLSRQIRLNAVASDPNGLPLTFSWRVIANSAAIIHGDTATPDVQFIGLGEYVFEVKVTNSAGLSATATVKVMYLC